ncbi:MAG: NifB/NifX family molybdenum-iron cluster-binding protein [Myxococcales bacterium]|jgi:ATP-binding protein involved in chromosome partitioning
MLTDQIKIAIPVAGGIVSAHFGHCDSFLLVKIDRVRKKVLKTEMVVPPPHEPDLLPRWLTRFGVHLVLTGGIGSRAKTLFQQQGIGVVDGAPPLEPQAVLEQYLTGTLSNVGNACDH